MGDARYNMGNSLMVGCAKMGLHFTACAPAKYFPDRGLVAGMPEHRPGDRRDAGVYRGPLKAVPGADVIYTDVWVSMGEPDEVWQERIADLSPYQVNARADGAGRPAVPLHALPALLP